VNQRLTGEVNLDEFEVSHTKDNIDWFGDQEQQVQDKLKEECWDYREIARQRRKGADDERGPSDLEIQTAVEELQQELTSSEIIDLVSIETIPPPEVVREGFRPLLESISTNDEPSYSADLGTATVKGYLANDPSPNDPYVLSDSTSGDKIVVVVNMNHPYLEKVVGSEGFLTTCDTARTMQLLSGRRLRRCLNSIPTRSRFSKTSSYDFPLTLRCMR